MHGHVSSRTIVISCMPHRSRYTRCSSTRGSLNLRPDNSATDAFAYVVVVVVVVVVVSSCITHGGKRKRRQLCPMDVLRSKWTSRPSLKRWLSPFSSALLFFFSSLDILPMMEIIVKACLFVLEPHFRGGDVV